MQISERDWRMAMYKFPDISHWFDIVDYVEHNNCRKIEINMKKLSHLLKAYYANQDAEKASSGGDSVQKSAMMKSFAEEFKKADISTLKTLFIGHNSFADKVSMKSNSISNAAAGSIGTYKSNGTYSNALSKLVSSKVDKEV